MRGNLIESHCYLTSFNSLWNTLFIGIVIPWAVAVAVTSAVPLVTVFTKMPSL